ncbi:hypothetical protein ACJRO7_035010 [Eucalyptus globulus]|uniref:FAD-binding domain-containing protein n=1 Tax=Eucalyptus globulus TaxID=34317 RepID=A0ABD3JF67_EUCGL
MQSTSFYSCLHRLCHFYLLYNRPHPRERERERESCGFTEEEEDVVIVGAGIAALATALGLHRPGIKSLVLESSGGLITTGIAFTTWTCTWRALDGVRIGKPSFWRLWCRLMTSSTVSKLSKAERKSDATRTQRVHEIRCLQRRTLLETLEKKLPSGTIKYSSKVVLIGCDGLNSAVAKWLGFKRPAFVGRSAIRGSAYYEHGQRFKPKIFQYIPEGVRFGVIACNDKSIYWFFTFSSSSNNEEMEESPAKIKQFVVGKLGKIPDNLRAVIGRTETDNMILKSNVCVAGDAFHPMTLDIGQGGCAALEDSIVLASFLGEMGLQSYAKQRRWRAFELISKAYMVGYIQQSNGRPLKMASYNCGKLSAT